MTGASTGRRTMAKRTAPTSEELATSLQLVGGFALTKCGQIIGLPDSGRRLVAFLALSERPRQAALVAAALWPERPDHRATANLRQARWKLASLVGSDLVQSDGGALSLDNAVRIDLVELSALGRTIIDDPESLADLRCARALLLELLPGWYDDWVIIERERVRQLHSRYTEAAIKELLRRNRTTDALDLALRLVSNDPLQETAQRALLTVYCAEGNYAEARRHLENFNALLSRELGVTSPLMIEDLSSSVAERR